MAEETAQTPAADAANPMMDPEVVEFMQASSTLPPAPVELSQYAEMFKDDFVITRENGVCTIRMHSNGDSAVFSVGKHNGWGRVLQYAGADPLNEIIVITGTGADFVRPVPEKIVQLMKARADSSGAGVVTKPQMLQQFGLYFEGVALIKNIIEDIDVPTIGVLNGPAGAMSALALLCDITICADDTTLEEAHFSDNLVPADGTMQAYVGLAGIKRSAYLGYMHQVIDAQTALDWGLVNEVVAKDKVMDRAYEIAAQIMKTDKAVRNVTHEIFKDYYRDFIKKLGLQFGTEAWAVPLQICLGDD